MICKAFVGGDMCIAVYMKLNMNSASRWVLR